VVLLETFADQVAICRARLSGAIDDECLLEVEAHTVAERLAIIETQLHDVVNAVPEGTHTYP